MLSFRSMQMLLFKLKSKSIQLFIPAVKDLNNRLRSSHGFVSGIILSSVTDSEQIFYLNMWMDAESAQLAREAAESHFRQISLDHEVIQNERLEVELSITSEGDFKPLVN